MTTKQSETKDTFIKSIERLSGEDRLTHNSMAKALGLTIGSWEYKVKKFGIKWRDYNIYNMRIDSVASSSALSSSPLVLLPTTLSSSSSVSFLTTESVASSSDEEASAAKKIRDNKIAEEDNRTAKMIRDLDERIALASAEANKTKVRLSLSSSSSSWSSWTL